MKGWLGKAETRGRSTLPMSERRISILQRRFVAKRLSTAPVADSHGTMRYPYVTEERAYELGWDPGR